MDVKTKRVYTEANPNDGFRILVDRLWPRGVTKARARIDLWLQEIAPSTALRKWFDHDPLKWEEFERRYHAELQRNAVQFDLLLAEARKHPVTLVYGAKDELRNEAVILQRLLKTQAPHTQH